MKDSAISYEADLFTLITESNTEAMTQLYKLHWERMFISAHNILRDRQAAEDIIHDIFHNLWSKRHSIQLRSGIEMYLSGAVRNHVFKYIRDNKVHSEIFENLPERMRYDGGIEERLYEKELNARVSGLLDLLPPKCREVYTLSREEHLSHKEIAERLDISTKTVERHISIALQTLRSHLGSPLMVSILAFVRRFWD